jgi:uncharacterized protein YbjT (DUF2867 family)
MMNPKLVLVTGATGNQGGAVTKHLLAKGMMVRALTRNSASTASEKLRQAGAELVQGDLNDPPSLTKALQGVDAVFSVQDFWAKGVGYEGELKQGVNLADAAAKAGVKHFVQSGMAKGQRIEGIEHFESKHAICEHLKVIGLPHTVIGTVYFMDNFMDPKRGGAMTFPTLSGSLKSRTKMHMLAVDDLGAIVSQVIAEPERYIGRYVDIASDCLTVREMKQIYHRVSGNSPKSWSLPAWLLRLFNKDFAKQLAWQNDPGWSFSVEPSRAIHPKLTSFEQFIRRHQISNL